MRNLITNQLFARRAGGITVSVWQRIHYLLTSIYAVIFILTFLLPAEIASVRWVVWIAASVVLISFAAPWLLAIKKRWAVRRSDAARTKVAASYFGGLAKLVDRFMILADTGSGDSVPRAITQALQVIGGKIPATLDHHASFYQLIKAYVAFKENPTPDPEALKNGIQKFDWLLDCFYQLFISPAAQHLHTQGVEFPNPEVKHYYNQTMSNLERLINEFKDFCMQARKDIGSIPHCQDFRIRKL